MIVHSDSDLGVMLAVVLMLMVLAAIVFTCVLLVERQFRAAAKLGLATLAIVFGWPLLVALIAALTPQTIVKLGDSYCADILCIGVQQVEKETRGAQTLYKLHVREFSDANTVKVSFGAMSLFLQDERGRRFPMIDDPSVTPYDVYLDPQQSVETTLTFAAASDAKELFLTEGPRVPASAAKQSSVGGGHPPRFIGPALGVWFYVASLGNDEHFLHKRTMMRVI